jgi:hypothetical protein
MSQSIELPARPRERNDSPAGTSSRTIQPSIQTSQFPFQPTGPSQLQQGDISQPCDPMSYNPNNQLKAFDVFAFIVNKMVGSGIFTAPMSSFLLTKSRNETIVLWVVAFIHTFFR